MSISPNVGAISKTLGAIVADPRTNRLRENGQAHDLRARRRVRRGRGGLRQERRGERQEPLLARACSSRSWASATSARSTGTTSTSCAIRCEFVRGMTGPRVVHVLTEKGKGFALRRIEPGEVARPRGLRPGHRRGAEEGERPADLDPGVRRRHHGARGRAPGPGGDHRGDALGHRHEHLPEEVARAVLRRRDRRRARRHLRRRPRDAGHPAGRARSTARSSSARTTTSSTTSRCSTCR